jgi:hypothetical protein
MLKRRFKINDFSYFKIQMLLEDQEVQLEEVEVQEPAVSLWSRWHIAFRLREPCQELNKGALSCSDVFTSFSPHFELCSVLRGGVDHWRHPRARRIRFSVKGTRKRTGTKNTGNRDWGHSHPSRQTLCETLLQSSLWFGKNLGDLRWKKQKYLYSSYRSKSQSIFQFQKSVGSGHRIKKKNLTSTA